REKKKVSPYPFPSQSFYTCTYTSSYFILPSLLSIVTVPGKRKRKHSIPSRCRLLRIGNGRVNASSKSIIGHRNGERRTKNETAENKKAEIYLNNGRCSQNCWCRFGERNSFLEL